MVNRRSLILSTFAFCASSAANLLLLWRRPASAADAKKSQEVMVTDQIERIKKLLEDNERENREANRRMRAKLSLVASKHRGSLTSVRYRTLVVRYGPDEKGNDIEIWIDGEQPDCNGLYDCGMVLLSASLAASFSDEQLMSRLREAFLVAIFPPYVAKLSLLMPFNGQPVQIKT